MAVDRTWCFYTAGWPSLTTASRSNGIILRPFAPSSASISGGMGDHDFTSIEENSEIFRDLPNGQLIIVPASNHGTFNKRPELVNLAIREFLNPPDNGAPPQAR